ncbi:plasmid transfer operon protein [Streptococcus equinus]|nr:plasmid transfer operon protein [Streptococcus equinus]SFR66740.1 plasmid transfer operon protein [Streptococcus equinus]
MEKKWFKDKKKIVVLLVALGLICSVKLGHDYVLHSQQSQEVYQVSTDSILQQDVNIVFYKKGCPYCEAGIGKVRREAKQSNVTTLFVDVDSSDGKKLTSRFDVVKAPTIVMVRNGSITLDYYAYDKDGDVYVNKDYIKKVFKD